MSNNVFSRGMKYFFEITMQIAIFECKAVVVARQMNKMTCVHNMQIWAKALLTDTFTTVSNATAIQFD